MDLVRASTTVDEVLTRCIELGFKVERMPEIMLLFYTRHKQAPLNVAQGIVGVLTSVRRDSLAPTRRLPPEKCRRTFHPHFHMCTCCSKNTQWFELMNCPTSWMQCCVTAHPIHQPSRRIDFCHRFIAISPVP